MIASVVEVGKAMSLVGPPATVLPSAPTGSNERAGARTSPV